MQSRMPHRTYLQWGISICRWHSHTSPHQKHHDDTVKVFEELSDECHISFNATKSKHTYFSKNKNNSCHPKAYEPCGNIIPTVECDKHLGNIIGQDTFQKVIQASINDLYQNVNMLLALFSNVMMDTSYKLFKTFCISVYGSQLWDFESKQLEGFYTACGKCIMRLLRLPYQTHSCLLHLICNDLPVNAQLQIRCIKFVKSCPNSKSPFVRMCYKLVIWGE